MPPAWAIAFLLSPSAARLVSANAAFALACADFPVLNSSVRGATPDRIAPLIELLRTGESVQAALRKLAAEDDNAKAITRVGGIAPLIVYTIYTKRHK
eukprot:1192285-Prorocentrum_minimum.AAC.1